jgi:cytochrome b pre-mRNA-processing protein 3
MLGFLFRGLTASPARGAALFDAVTSKAREPYWYVEGDVPDTLDGRFAVLATVAALSIVRLEQLGEKGIAQSVALTERFIEVMEAEHRELGLGDPTLGKTVRKLVGSLGRRTELWRSPALAKASIRTSRMRPR